MEKKRFKIVSQQGIRSIYWQIFRLGHPTMGDYLMTEIYDESSLVVIVASLLKRGFTEVEEINGRSKERQRDIVFGEVRQIG